MKSKIKHVIERLVGNVGRDVSLLFFGLMGPPNTIKIELNVSFIS
jgi:hypothetical protein